MDPKNRGNTITGLNLKLNSPNFSDGIDHTENNKINSNMNTKSEEYKPKKVNIII